MIQQKIYLMQNNGQSFAETYPEACPTSKMECFVKIVHGFQLFLQKALSYKSVFLQWKNFLKELEFEWVNCVNGLFELVNILFLYLLKTLENQRFSYVFRGYRNGTLV